MIYGQSKCLLPHFGCLVNVEVDSVQEEVAPASFVHRYLQAVSQDEGFEVVLVGDLAKVHCAQVFHGGFHSFHYPVPPSFFPVKGQQEVNASILVELS